jgi:putative spermidine/putrescine transport system substrate-binding protein
MKTRKLLSLLWVMALIGGLVAACGSPATPETVIETVVVTQEVAQEGEEAGPPSRQDEYSKEWIAEQLNKEGQLLIYYPTGANFKTWLNDTLVPGFATYIKDTYGVDLQIALLSTGGGDAAFWQKLQAFREGGGKPGQFDIDVVRVAPDFQTLDAIEQGWFLPILPDYAPLAANLADVNQPGLATFTLDGTSYAIPFYQPTVSMFYNSEKLPNPPQTLEELGTWVKENPQRFTYEDPRSSSGVGSGTMFLLTTMHYFGDENDPSTWDEAWTYLKDMQENVYPQPNTGEQALELMRKGEIYLMAFWNDWGIFAKDTLDMPFMQNYLLESGMPIRNTPFAIPTDARHPVAALLFVDYALSPEMQSSLGQVMHQIPAHMGQATWDAIPQDAFGFQYEYIVDHTFPAFNSRENVDAIKAMAEGWSEKVLGR